MVNRMVSQLIRNYTILYFLDYGKSFGGAVNALLQQAILMKKAGHRVVLFFSDYLGNEIEADYEGIYRELGIEWIWTTYQISSQTEDIDVVCLVRNYDKLKKEISSYNPDLLHSVQINPGVELVGRELKIPHIMNIYPLIPEFFTVDYLNVFPHYHLCDSWYYAKKWQYYLKTDSSCIRTVVNSRHKRNWSIDRSLINYICVGSIYKEKNQLAVITSFHKALQNGVNGRLTLCGYANSGYADKCRRYIEENRLNDKIFLKDFCPDMQAEYDKSDVLICGSKRESYPNVISEAMANGLVIISTPVAGVPEVIENDVNGYLARDYSADALYEKIMCFHKDLLEGKVEQILKNAEQSFQECHAPQKVMLQLQQYYRYVCHDYDKRKNTNTTIVDITAVKNAFGDLIYKFTQAEMHFTDSQKVGLKLWYLFHVEERIRSAYREGKCFYIWGTGKYGIVVKELIDYFLPDIHISGFLDSCKKGTYLEYNIYNPEEMIQKENVAVFIAAVNGQDEMIERLEGQKKIFNKDFFILSSRRW